MKLVNGESGLLLAHQDALRVDLAETVGFDE